MRAQAATGPQSEGEAALCCPLRRSHCHRCFHIARDTSFDWAPSSAFLPLPLGVCLSEWEWRHGGGSARTPGPPAPDSSACGTLSEGLPGSADVCACKPAANLLCMGGLVRCGGRRGVALRSRSMCLAGCRLLCVLCRPHALRHSLPRRLRGDPKRRRHSQSSARVRRWTTWQTAPRSRSQAPRQAQVGRRFPPGCCSRPRPVARNGRKGRAMRRKSLTHTQMHILCLNPHEAH